MKLFVWVDPYDINYGSAMVFAVAETEEQAREVAMGANAKAWAFGGYEDSELKDLEPNRKGLELGTPSRVVDLPCAEWHRWEE